MRAQANLPALAIALLVLTTTAGLSLSVADGAFSGADRTAEERATATAIADRLVSADGIITDRANVINASRLDAGTLRRVVPDGVPVRVAVGGETLYTRGAPTGPTARRLVLVAERQRVEIDPPLRFGVVILPRRSPRATISIEPSAGVETVRANDRVVLHDPSGLDGEHNVSISRYETTTLHFDGDPDPGDVSVVYYPRRTRKALLEVTVGA